MSREYHHAASLSGLLIGASVPAPWSPRSRSLPLARRPPDDHAHAACDRHGVVAFALLPSLGLGLAGLMVMGFGYLSSNTAATSRLQLEVAPEHRGG